MTAGFKAFLRLRSRHVPAGGRPLWKELSRLTMSPDEVKALSRIEDLRRRLETDARAIQRTDFGVGPTRGSAASPDHVFVGQIARAASVSPLWGRFLFKLVRLTKPRRILELGTCLGISAAYLQTALELSGGGDLITIEGDPNLCSLAQENLESLSLHPGQVIEGRFDLVLESVLEANKALDLVFIDGHHDPEAVRTYFGMIESNLSAEAVVVVDDIQPLTGAVRPAWKSILLRTPHAWAVDLVRMGILQTPTAQ